MPADKDEFERRRSAALKSTLRLSILTCVTLAISSSVHAESLPPLKDGKSPQTVEAVWAGYDPTAEPLETQIIKEWEEDGVVIRAVRYCTGTFKGQKAWMAGLYAFPKGKVKLPSIVEIHGGGGRANKKACIAYAKRGYATISLSWRADQRYLTDHGLPEAARTDWGAVEGRQVSESRGIEPDNEKRFDPVPSARNGGYFLRVLAARRALTFLQKQKEVDGERLWNMFNFSPASTGWPSAVNGTGSLIVRWIEGCKRGRLARIRFKECKPMQPTARKMTSSKSALASLS